MNKLFACLILLSALGSPLATRLDAANAAFPYDPKGNGAGAKGAKDDLVFGSDRALTLDGGTLKASDTASIAHANNGDAALRIERQSQFVPDRLNSVLVAAGVVAQNEAVETTTIQEGSRQHVWFATAPDFTTLSYTYSDDAARHVYAAPVTCLTDIRFPYIIKSGSTYYLFALKMSGATETDLYCWTSTNRTTWAIAHGGSPVLTRGTGVWSRIWNPAVVEIGGVAHLWIEISTDAGQSDVGLAYSYSTLAALDFNANRTAGKIIDRGGNANAIAVPDRSAVLLLHGRINTANKWEIRASTIATSANFALAASYSLSDTLRFSLEGAHVTDPDLVVDATGTYPLLLRYCPDQANSHQAYFAGSLNALYDAAVGRSVNYLAVASAAAGFPVTLVARGSDENISIVLRPKGSGNVQVRGSLDVLGNITAGNIDQDLSTAAAVSFGRLTLALGDFNTPPLQIVDAQNGLYTLSGEWYAKGAGGNFYFRNAGGDGNTFSATTAGGTFSGGTLTLAGKSLVLGGNLSTVGSSAIAFTSTGATALTLPLSGTLATLAGAESLTNKKLGSLTSNGFVKTSGGDGTLSIDTATYLTASTGVTTLAGTADQVLVNGATSAASGAITLTLPQSLGTTSAVNFGSLALTGNAAIGGQVIAVLGGSGSFASPALAIGAANGGGSRGFYESAGYMRVRSGNGLMIDNADGTGAAAFFLNNGTAVIEGDAQIAGVVGVGGQLRSSTTALITPASTTGVSSLRIPHGTAPTSPVDGDTWTTTAGLFVRINGATVGPLN